MANEINQCKTCGDRYCCRGPCLDRLKVPIKQAERTVIIEVNKNGIRRERIVCRKN